jgi:hypothetical protein
MGINEMTPAQRRATVTVRLTPDEADTLVRLRERLNLLGADYESICGDVSWTTLVTVFGKVELAHTRDRIKGLSL